MDVTCYYIFHSSYNKIDKKIQYFEILLVFQKSKTIFVIQKYILFFNLSLYILSHMWLRITVLKVCVE